MFCVRAFGAWGVLGRVAAASTESRIPAFLYMIIVHCIAGKSLAWEAGIQEDILLGSTMIQTAVHTLILVAEGLGYLV